MERWNLTERQIGQVDRQTDEVAALVERFKKAPYRPHEHFTRYDIMFENGEVRWRGQLPGGLRSMRRHRGRYERFGEAVPVPAFNPRMVCTSCGIIGAFARPNWQERPTSESLTGKQWE